jgi:4-amino-4-deoxy-L-arabinose transferase-like glycosyltransferase
MNANVGAARLPRLRTAGRTGALSVPRPELLGLLLLALVLNVWGLSQNGWANEYYSAAVRSMSSSWHNFLYTSFDSSGVMTVDKPPLALWVQALSARVFGFGSLSILVPQALMGVASVGLTYDLTRRTFGRVAGSVAGLVLALTPMSVAIARHNNPDALLVLCCVAALWFVVRGLEDGRTRWLVLSGVMIGLGFETKMAAALIVVPALATAWLWVAPRGRVTALKQLAAGGAAMTMVGLAWPVLVWLTPAGSRPWVSGTSDNSIWSLITGYNGLGRLDGQAGGPGGAGPGGPGGGPGGNGGPFGGASGPLRLLNESLGGQAGWLLGAAAVSGIAVIVATRLRRDDPRTGWIVAVGGSFAATALAFSFAQGIFHPYYVSQLAPFTAALVGAGAVALLRGGLAGRILAPAAVAVGVFAEMKILRDNQTELGWVVPVLIGAGGLAAAALAMEDTRRVRAIALSVAFGALMIAPAVWSVQTLGHATGGTFPAGGPTASSFGGPGGGGMRGGFGPPPGPMAGPGGGMFGGNSSLTAATAYVTQHGGGTIAVSSQSGASSAVLSSNAHVAAIGGFSGRESQVTVDWLADAVASGKIRWVLTGGQMGGPGGDSRTGSATAEAAVTRTCKAAPTSSGATGLYDCSGQAAALRVAG